MLQTQFVELSNTITLGPHVIFRGATGKSHSRIFLGSPLRIIYRNYILVITFTKTACVLTEHEKKQIQMHSIFLTFVTSNYCSYIFYTSCTLYSSDL